MNLNRAEIVDLFDKKINVDTEDAESNYTESRQLLDHVLKEVEDYKKNLEKNGIELTISQGEKDLKKADFGLDTQISVSGVKPSINISYNKGMEAFEVGVQKENFILPIDKSTDDEVYVVEDTQEINNMSYAAFMDMIMLKMLGENTMQ